MVFRFQKRIKILPGLRLNISKMGISWTVGTRGASVTSQDGNLTGIVGLPGTGVSYRKRIDLPDSEVESQDQPVKPTGSGKPSWLPLLIVLVIGIVIGLSLR